MIIIKEPNGNIVFDGNHSFMLTRTNAPISFIDQDQDNKYKHSYGLRNITSYSIQDRERSMFEARCYIYGYDKASVHYRNKEYWKIFIFFSILMWIILMVMLVVYFNGHV